MKSSTFGLGLSHLIPLHAIDRYPVTEQITSQHTSTSLATVLSQATPGFQSTSKLCIN